jgi:hypothetical protein
MVLHKDMLQETYDRHASASSSPLFSFGSFRNQVATQMRETCGMLQNKSLVLIMLINLATAPEEAATNQFLI